MSASSVPEKKRSSGNVSSAMRCGATAGEFRVEMSITALNRRGGLVFNVFFRDLTEKIAAEDRIRQAEKIGKPSASSPGGIARRSPTIS